MSSHAIWVLSAIVGAIILFGGRRSDSGRPRRFSRLVLIAAVVGGLALVGHRWREVTDHGRWEVVDVAADADPGDVHAELPQWMLISFVTAIIISGVLVARRDRIRPGTLRLVTALGVAASCFALVSFFGSPPRHFGNRDRIVKVSMSNSNASDDAPAEPAKPKTHGNRPPRAKRPTHRPRHSADAAVSNDELPPRAGEIPVAAELARTTDAKEAAEPTAPTAAPATPAMPAAPEAAAPEASVPAAPIATAPATPAPTAPASTAPPDAPAAQPPTPAAEQPKPADPAPSAPAATTASKPAEAAPPPSAPIKPAPAIPRPAWVEAPGKLVGSVYSTSVKSGLYVDVPECQRALDEAIKREADQYIDDYVGPGAARVVAIPRGYLRDHVKKVEFAEIKESNSVGPMHQLHALLEFDDDARAEFHRRWREAVVTGRLWYVGSGAALVLALLGTFYGYLRLDLRTPGSHKGRLQLAAALVALIAAAGALLVRWAVPF